MRPLSVLIALAVLVAPAVPVGAQAPNPAEDNVTENPFTIEVRLQRIQAIHPEFVTLDAFGSSIGGFPLHAAYVHHPDADVDRIPTYYIDGNHHGNEQYGMEAALIFLEELVEWSKTEEGAARLKEVRVVVAPMINPDGTAADKRGNANNVDLNRNYDYHWGLYGTSDVPVDSTYRGSAPFSEPESRANGELMEAIHPDVYLSMHTGTHDIVLPWRAEEDGPMPDWPVYERFLAGIKDVSGLDYREPSGAGESTSWAYGMLGAVALIPEVDETQFAFVTPDNLRDVLKEEVAICWYGLEVVEKLGGNLAVVDGRLVNDGWGPALSVTLHDGAGNVIRVLPEVAPGATVEGAADASAVTWERRIQGEGERPLGHLDLASVAAELVDDAPALTLPVPAWILLVAVAIVGVPTRRRP